MRNRILGVVCSIGVMSCHSAYAATKFEVTAETFAKGQLSELNVLNGFGCTGKNISPKITWHGEPEGTQSYVVSMYDPDAPTGSGWWHWVIANIPASVHEIPKRGRKWANRCENPGRSNSDQYGFWSKWIWRAMPSGRDNTPIYYYCHGAQSSQAGCYQRYNWGSGWIYGRHEQSG